MTISSSTDDRLQWDRANARFRFAGRVSLLVFLVAWVAWFYPFDNLVDRSGTPLGGDYVMLYVAGQTIAMGQAESLYHDARNQQRSAALFPSMDSNQCWPFRYPPTVAACMAPLSQLPYQWSFAIFFCMQLGLLGINSSLLSRDYECIQEYSGWLWAIVGSPLIIETLIGGQASLIALSCVLGFAHFYRKHDDTMAGVMLALTLYKPNVLALFILGCLVVRPRLLRGFLPVLGMGIVVALLTSGPAGLAEYLRLGTQLASSTWSLETPYWKVHGLAPYFQALIPEFGKFICFAIGVGLSSLIAAMWRSGRWSANPSMAWLLCINSLFNPYVPIYDLVLLIPAAVFACEAAWTKHWPAQRPLAFQAIAAALFFGPHLSQALAMLIGWQLFPLVTLAVLTTIVGTRRSSWGLI